MDRLQEGEQLAERAKARGLVTHQGWAYQVLGRAALLLGRLEEASRLGAHALELSPCQAGYAAYAHYLLGDAMNSSDAGDATCESHYLEALALAEPRGMRPLIAHCHLGLGNHYRRIGNDKQAQEHLSIATAMYRQMDMTYWLEQAAAQTRQLE